MPYIITTTGTQLFYRDWGAGKPIVFVSGWSLSSRQWQQQMYHLSQNGYRCIAYDRAGHGLSDDPGQGYDYDTLARHLASLINHLAISDITFIAHSMGCGEVVRYITTFGNTRISRIVFIAPTLPFPLQTENNPYGAPPAVFKAQREIFENDFPKWLQENKAPYLGKTISESEVFNELGNWTITDMLQTSLQAVIECNRAVSETDFREELKAISLPVLVIQGDADASIPVEISGNRVAQLMPQSKLLVYKNAPHGLYLTHRKQLMKDLLEFLQENN